MMNRTPVFRQKLYSTCLYILAVLGLLLPGRQILGQSTLPLGSWRMHVPYQQAMAVADAGDRVYAAVPNGLFYYDREFNATQTISKVDGLREQQISAIGYDAATGTLVIAYASTQVGLLRGNTIYNIQDIFRKAIPGKKRINHIYLHNGLAYLSCSFGVVVLDLQKLEVKATYSNLGLGGRMVSVQSTAILRDSIYIATNLGVLAAQQNGTNLQDFRSWSALSNSLPTPGAAASLAAFNDKLYAGTAASGLYRLSGKNWQRSAVVDSTAAIRSLAAGNGYMAVATTASVVLLNQQQQAQALTHEPLRQPQDAVVGADGYIWVADSVSGLVRLHMDGTNAAAFAPDGPYSGGSFRLYTHSGKTYVLSGGYTEGYTPSGIRDGFFVHENGRWTSYNQFLYPNPQEYIPTQDLVAAIYNPITDRMYFGSYGDGVLEWSGPGQPVLYDNSNSTLVSTSAPEGGEQVRVTDMAVDAAGNVWVVNPNRQANAPGLHRLEPDGTWTSFRLPGVAGETSLELLLLDDIGQKWLSFSRHSTNSGLAVYDEVQNRVKILSVGEGNGGLPDGAVYGMAKDMSGDIWVGTASGIAVYYNPRFAFETQPYDAYLPIIDGRPLLNGQTVRAIAVDGANRKWVGTEDGLWLFSPDGDELLQHYTSQNSPLPSDSVLSVAVEHQTGEVFVATAGGLASYRAGATVTEGEPECATVFPNPVRRDYTGLVGVSGLPNNAHVRITDISGTLVYKTRATGGTLAWNARDYNGRRVKAGVYLVMSSDESGKQTCISKIAVLE
ncbi:type IX secretion system anionic LPS delivery protein PorZ [Pontibacter russatus]|uniref:type IX secretion system anionic LPS delivery protein PorZ n=1 Tax=Pontibacter russatus TaxID=2694929 RepID=UPI00137A4D61|nr:two-component regulator propeller domain-containing protein [Pontibacter russatus]